MDGAFKVKCYTIANSIFFTTIIVIILFNKFKVNCVYWSTVCDGVLKLTIRFIKYHQQTEESPFHLMISVELWDWTKFSDNYNLHEKFVLVKLDSRVNYNYVLQWLNKHLHKSWVEIQ